MINNTNRKRIFEGKGEQGVKRIKGKVIGLGHQINQRPNGMNKQNKALTFALK